MTHKDDTRAYYEHIGHLGGIACKVQRGVRHFTAIGAIGGKATSARRGPEYYARIGKLGAEAKHRNWMRKKAGAAHG